MSSDLFSSEQIRQLLTELGARLEAWGEHAALFIFGGAAIAVCQETRRTLTR